MPRHLLWTCALLIGVLGRGCEKSPEPGTVLPYPSGPVAAVALPAGFTPNAQRLPAQLEAHKGDAGTFVMVDVAPTAQLTDLTRTFAGSGTSEQLPINGFAWTVIATDKQGVADFVAQAEADGHRIQVMARGDYWTKATFLDFLGNVTRRAGAPAPP